MFSLDLQCYERRDIDCLRIKHVKETKEKHNIKSIILYGRKMKILSFIANVGVLNSLTKMQNLITKQDSLVTLVEC